MKKVIRSSNLALRFYISDGWTKEELDKLCSKGEVRSRFPTDMYPYLSLTQGSRFDTTLLLDSCSALVRAFDDYPSESDREFVERMM
jgi:hypothetical protein